LVEHLTFNQRVEGSNPSWLTKDFCKSKIIYAGVAELADAPDLGSGAARRGGSSPFTRTLKVVEITYEKVLTQQIILDIIVFVA
jgi:hypothetical protein